MKQKVWFSAVVLFLSCIITAQTLEVSGIVTSEEDGSLLPGVSVLEKSTANGVQTDFDGNYEISVSQGSILTRCAF